VEWKTVADGLGVSFEVIELRKTLFASEWTFPHPEWYTGKVWIRLQPKRVNRHKNHELTVRWGEWSYRRVLNFEGHKKRSLSHTKRLPDCHWIRVEINPPCSLDYGIGAPPKPVIDINDGWTDDAAFAASLRQFLELCVLLSLNPVDLLLTLLAPAPVGAADVGQSP
jgi:hypothetical protein